MEELENNILKKLNISLADLAETIPSPLTTDAQILEAEKHYLEDNLWPAFHHLSLTHSTLMFHRLSIKLNRPQGKSQKVEVICEDKNRGKKSNDGHYYNSQSNTLRSSSPDETKRCLELLPSDWTVIQITSENRMSGNIMNWKRIEDPSVSPPLYVARCRCGPSPSIILKKVLPPKDSNSVRSILHEMELIKAENKVMMNYYKDDLEKYKSKREEVNNRLRVLVQSMENGWFQHLTCLLAGSLAPHSNAHVDNKVKAAARKCRVSLTEEQLILLKLMISFPPPSNKSRGNVSFDPPLKGGVAFVLNDNIRSSKVRNLTDALLAEQKDIKDIRESTRSPVILVLDKSVVSLPWEMIWSLQNQPVTRMPSLSSLVHLYLHHTQKEGSLLTKGVDASNGFFILDPENNLPRTQTRLCAPLTQTGWNGVKGKRPSHEQFEEALVNNDVFVYVGHGSGSQYMPAHLVETLDCHSMVLLYGCSSACLAKRGAIPDPWGIILNYLNAYCPCVVGMLWEVMDKDTDLLTREMVRALRGIKGEPGSPLEDPPTDVAHLVAKARPLCSWYLISAALVVYGLPLQVVLRNEDLQ